MKIKHFLYIFLIGFALQILGSTFKVLHFPGTAFLLLAGGLVQFLAIIGLVLKLMISKKAQDFLNW